MSADPPSCPEFAVGSPVDSSDLRFREDFIAGLWETLRTRHVLLTAPRRTGKTSVMDHLRDFPQHGYTVVYLNVQDLTHPDDFFQTILEELQDQDAELVKRLAKGWKLLGNALSKVAEVGFAGFKLRLRESDPNWKDNWRQHGDQFLDQIRKQESPVLLIVDELPDMLTNLKKEKRPGKRFLRLRNRGQSIRFRQWHPQSLVEEILCLNRLPISACIGPD